MPESGAAAATRRMIARRLSLIPELFSKLEMAARREPSVWCNVCCPLVMRGTPLGLYLALVVLRALLPFGPPCGLSAFGKIDWLRMKTRSERSRSSPLVCASTVRPGEHIHLGPRFFQSARTFGRGLARKFFSRSEIDFPWAPLCSAKFRPRETLFVFSGGKNPRQAKVRHANSVISKIPAASSDSFFFLFLQLVARELGGSESPYALGR